MRKEAPAATRCIRVPGRVNHGVNMSISVLVRTTNTTPDCARALCSPGARKTAASTAQGSQSLTGGVQHGCKCRVGMLGMAQTGRALEQDVEEGLCGSL